MAGAAAAAVAGVGAAVADDIARIRTDAAPLLARVQAFGFSEPGDPLAFESRLADDQGWTLGYALAVVEQYRRFLVLTQVAGRPVSPSPDVDEAWHLHLTRTAHYEAFCADVFGRFLHHEPARPGEGPRHRDMYRETLDLYERVFHADPPATIWPASGAARAARRAIASSWLVPWSLRRGHRLAAAVVLVAFAGALLLLRLGALASLQAIGPLAFLGLALLATLALGWHGLRAGTPGAEVAERDVLDPYEAAWLSGGAERMTMTAVVVLTERGILLPPGRSPQHGPRLPIPVNMTVEPRFEHPAEVACMKGIVEGGLRFSAACRAMLPLADQVERRLVAAGIVGDAGALPARRSQALRGMLLVLVVEFERFMRALDGSHRFGFLALLILAGVGLVVALARRPRRAGARAEHALRPLRLAAGQYRKAPAAGEALAFGVALVGGTVLADDLRFDGLGQQVNAMPLLLAQRRSKGKDGGDSDCSSCSSCTSGDGGGSADGGGSDGGSSCGSGCGGGGD